MGPEGNNPRLTALWFNTIFPLSGATYLQTEYPLPDLSDLMLGQARVAQAFELVHLWLPLCSALQTAVYGPAHQGRFQSCTRATATFSSDGRLLVTASGNRALIWAVAGELLQSTIAAATTVCLKPEFRRQNLGESATEARRKYEACERKHGRER